jgi:hypothetical protein
MSVPSLSWQIFGCFSIQRRQKARSRTEPSEKLVESPCRHAAAAVFCCWNLWANVAPAAAAVAAVVVAAVCRAVRVVGVLKRVKVHRGHRRHVELQRVIVREHLRR